MFIVKKCGVSCSEVVCVTLSLHQAVDDAEKACALEPDDWHRFVISEVKVGPAYEREPPSYGQSPTPFIGGDSDLFRLKRTLTNRRRMRWSLVSPSKELPGRPDEDYGSVLPTDELAEVIEGACNGDPQMVDLIMDVMAKGG